jgi:arylsulfatase A-like enzyme
VVSTVVPNPAPKIEENVSVNNAKKPNIVIILADDVGTGALPFYWKEQSTSKVEMPNLTKLANKSVLFTDAHSTPLCAPTRYMILSGNYPHRGKQIYGTWKFGNSNQFAAHQKSIAQVLQEHGYNTGMFGKWHLGGKVPPAGIQSEDQRSVLTNPAHDWSQPLIEGPSDIGFNTSHIALEGIQSSPYSFFHSDILTTSIEDVVWWNAGEYKKALGTSIINPGHEGEGDQNWDSSAFDMIVVNETKAFIEQHLSNQPEDPFFAHVALGTVHIPHSPPDAWDGDVVKGTHATAHLDMLYTMDKAVGSIVSMIEDKGLAENTIVIFTSDNGGLDISTSVGHVESGPFRGYKGQIWEGGHRVPLMISYGNKLPGGERHGALVGLNDIYATICDIIGIAVPSGSAEDSISFAPYLKLSLASKLHEPRSSLGIWKLQNGRSKGKIWEFAWRAKELKLIYIPQNKTIGLFNLTDDISEEKNLLNGADAIKYIEQAKIMYEALMATGPCSENKHEKECKANGVLD